MGCARGGVSKVLALGLRYICFLDPGRSCIRLPVFACVHFLFVCDRVSLTALAVAPARRFLGFARLVRGAWRVRGELLFSISKKKR